MRRLDAARFRLAVAKLIRHLSGALQDVVGLNEAAGFVSIVGQRMGDEIGDAYKAALDTSQLDRNAVRDVCLDLKRRIEGDFSVIERRRHGCSVCAGHGGAGIPARNTRARRG